MVNRSTLLVFTKQFAAMLRSQLPLVEILDNLAKDTPHRAMRHLIHTISRDVQQGIDLGQALAGFPKVFDDVYLSVIRAGLSSGRLAEAMLQVAGYLRRADSINRQVRGAIAYPLFIVITLIGIFNVMVFFILPRFEVIFSSLGSRLPAPTRLLLAMGATWRESWPWILPGLLVTGLVAAVWGSTRDGRYLWDRYKLRLPVLGKMWRMLAMSRFLRTLAVQVKNDVPLLEALTLSAAASGNLYIREVLHVITLDVERGSGISQAFRRHAVFSGIVLQMISSGEEAGILDELLLSASEFFEETLEEEIRTLVGLVNPVLTLLTGVLVAGMMVASFLPIFQMGGINPARM